jgi:hypothetical protein
MGTPVAEAAGFGWPKVKADNEVWVDLRRNPKGRGHPLFEFRPDFFVAPRLHMPDMRTPRA